MRQHTPFGCAIKRRELLFMADACHRAGARCITAIVPYFGYARQDRRGKGREPVGSRLASDLLAAADIARVVAVDLHTPELEGFMSIPLEHLSAIPILARTVAPLLAENSVVVSPDLGGVKLAERYARALGLPLAVVHKALIRHASRGPRHRRRRGRTQPGNR
jgi:ribose-phosphate pyrophosphokinase